jgi:hypothetical protein
MSPPPPRGFTRGAAMVTAGLVPGIRSVTSSVFSFWPWVFSLAIRSRIGPGGATNVTRPDGLSAAGSRRTVPWNTTSLPEVAVSEMRSTRSAGEVTMPGGISQTTVTCARSASPRTAPIQRTTSCRLVGSTRLARCRRC